MVARIVGGTSLPDDVLAQIVAKSDGVPLFVEELTKSVVESGSVTVNTIPDTLQDRMVRIDLVQAFSFFSNRTGDLIMPTKLTAGSVTATGGIQIPCR